MAEGFWGLVVIIGPIVLIAALAFAMLRNKQTKREFERTEAATRRMHEEQAAQDRTTTP
ncbi:hypothetical protein [Sphingomonas aracearum]|uniref:hypothetical protein n=1 Tax=Sphingomonas aracearum TaxID=2283317 RepID=UPI0015F0FDC7|nr:hypothetical protein [Sphingomonas aracearum]